MFFENDPLLSKNNSKLWLLDFDQLMKLAQSGNSEAQCLVGYSFRFGWQGCKINVSEGNKILIELANKNDNSAGSHCAQGFCYEHGIGNVKIKNFAKAKECYTEAAKQQYIPAKTILANILYHEAIATTTATIERGAYTATVKQEVSQNKEQLTEAVNMLTECAELDFAPALHFLSLCYYNGHGVTQDKKYAFNLTASAAEKGHAQAKENMGIFYRDETSTVKQDYSKAYEWFKAAKKQGMDVEREIDNMPTCPTCTLV